MRLIGGVHHGFQGLFRFDGIRQRNHVFWVNHRAAKLLTQTPQYRVVGSRFVEFQLNRLNTKLPRNFEFLTVGVRHRLVRVVANGQDSRVEGVGTTRFIEIVVKLFVFGIDNRHTHVRIVDEFVGIIVQFALKLDGFVFPIHVFIHRHPKLAFVFFDA